jgi:Cof subfamily protein (haloacid dehalogenase superfamily)
VDYDLFAIDLDGTLLNAQHELSAENRAALHQAHEAGVRIVLCTGRAYTETEPVLAQIGLDLDASVTVFGALVTDIRTGETIERTPIPLHVGHAVTSWFQDEGYPVLWLTDPNETGHDGFMLRGKKRHPAVDAWLERSPCQVQQVDQIPELTAAPLRLSVIDDEGPLEMVSARLSTEFADRIVHNVLHAPPYKLSLIEAFAPVVSKWHGIKKLCKEWQVDPARVMAIGDDVNDVAMLRHAGLGVAVSNAKEGVKNVADRMVASNDENGVAQLIEELLGA